jgi:hypothetical protein
LAPICQHINELKSPTACIALPQVHFLVFYILIFPLTRFTAHHSPLASRYISGNNTGFKNFNPECPCRRCWYQHARPYAGALIYAPWPNDNNVSSSSNSGTNFQRPLPTYRPNQQHQQQQTSLAVTSQTCGRYRRLLRVISSPDLSPSKSQTQRRLQRPPALPPAPQLIHRTLPLSRSISGIQLGELRITGMIGSKILPFLFLNSGTQ